MSLIANHPVLDASLQQLVEQQRAQFQSQHPQQQIAPELEPCLAQVWASSDFVFQQCLKYPQLVHGSELALLQQVQQGADFAARLQHELTPSVHGSSASGDVAAGLPVVDEVANVMAVLRRFRNREMARIAWRDLAGWAELDQTLAELSALADTCVQQALNIAEQQLYSRHGLPRDAEGNVQRLVVIAMGKLGAHELNFSSDIDLVFAWPKPGQSDGERPLDNQQLFSKIIQKVVKYLAETTADGFVYRVDLRLRPYGQSGPLAMHFEQTDDYFQAQGRDWERYAWIKARPIAGDVGAGEHLLEMLRPFVYRRYLDFSAFAALRSMKAMIEAEVKRKGIASNIKLGAGGIREIEFTGQAFQLIRGGREPSLRQRPIRLILARLQQLDLLPATTVAELDEAYVFLRRLENRLQALRDQQTHDLPADELIQQRIALAMGCADWAELATATALQRQRVQGHFACVMAAPQSADGHAADNDWDNVWRAEPGNEVVEAHLAQHGFVNPEQVLQHLQSFHQGASARRFGSQGVHALDRLIPMTLAASASFEQPQRAFLRLLQVVEAIGGRSAYLNLLVESPLALSQLVRLCDASPWITHQLAQHPILLDELLDPRQLYLPRERKELQTELQRRLQAEAQDEEQQLILLREFKQAAGLRVACADLTGSLPLMKVSDHLTDLAELLLEEVLRLAWQQTVAKYGVPRCEDERGPRQAGFVIVAYGKLGGYELGYGSDLDIVFVHDSAGTAQQTDGPRCLDNQVFFIRLAQRVVHILSAVTSAGKLYDVDMRLRPSGNSGLLVTSLPAWMKYQTEQAWTWEHQALVRSRPVAGDAHLADAVRTARNGILVKQRDLSELRQQVKQMRQKMRKHLSQAKEGEFDLKQDAGAIADIEFMVQYAVLGMAHQCPDLLRYPDNIRILETLAAHGVWPEQECHLLADAYRTYRERGHRLALQESPAVVGADEFAQLSATVSQLWASRLGD